MSSLVPSNFKEWLQLISTLSAFCLWFIPVVSRRMKRAAVERKAMHEENTQKFIALEKTTSSIDVTLKIQNGTIQALKSRVSDIERHIWDDTGSRSRRRGDNA